MRHACPHFALSKSIFQEENHEFFNRGVQALTWQQVVMYAVGILLIYLAIEKGYEPSLLLPMGFGAILVNLPFTGVLDQTLQGGIQANGVIEWLYNVGINASEAMPILLFIGIGAMIDFGPTAFHPTDVFIWCRCTVRDLCSNPAGNRSWF